jgi:hypothetical protein
MSVIFEGAEKARSKVNAFELAKDLATSNAVASVGATDVSEFQGNDPAIQSTLRWASSTFVDAGVNEPDIDPSFGEIVGAAFRQSNTVGSALASNDLRERLSPTINSAPLTPKELYARVDNDGLLPHLSLFRGARSEAEYEAIKNDVARELQDRKILAASGALGFATEFGAAALDLPSLIPGAAIARTAKLATRGKKIAAVEGAIAGFAGSVAAEAALQGTQQLRTAEESLFAIGAGTILSGAIGAGVDAVFGRQVADSVSTRFDEARAIAATGDTSAAHRLSRHSIRSAHAGSILSTA